MDTLDAATEELILPEDERERTFVSSVSSLSGGFQGKPRPLPPLRPEAPALKPSLLPESLQAWVKDIADRMQVSLEMVAIPALVGLAAVIGRRVAIHPKAKDSWFVVPNLWGGIVARPGKLKSPALAEALGPIKELASKAMQEYDERAAEIKAQEELLNVEESAIKDLLRKGFKEATEEWDQGQLGQDLKKVYERKKALLVAERRYIVNDSTVEKLGALLSTSFNGLLLERDELAGFLKSLDRQDRVGDREFYLESWNGTNPYTVDRIGRGTIRIPALCLSVIGGIQPGKLSAYVSEAIAGGVAADGLLQRLQLLVWPEDRADWELVDRFPDQAARDLALEVFTEIDQLPWPENREDIQVVRFCDEAQSLFNEWLTELEGKLRSNELGECPAYESHLSKYRSLMPSLALIFHLAAERGSVGSPVSLAAAKLAAAWCEYLEQHARKVYAQELNPGLASAHALVAKIKKGLVEDGMTVRDLHRKGWTRLKNADDADEATLVAEKYGWLRLEVSNDKGRPSQVIRLSEGARRK